MFDEQEVGSFVGGKAGAAALGAAAAGSTIGAALGSAVPVVGTLIGSFLGSKLGGLFGDDGDFPYARISLDTTTLLNEDSLDGAKSVRTLGENLLGTVDSFFTYATGSSIAASGVEAKRTTIGVNTDRGHKLGTGFFAGSGGDFNKGATYTQLKTADEAIDRGALFYVQNIKDFGSIDQGTADFLRETSQNSETFEELAQRTIEYVEGNAAQAASENDGGVSNGHSQHNQLTGAAKSDPAISLLLLAAGAFTIFK